MLEAGAIDAPYIEAMLERERSVSTYLGEGVAVPHGTLSGKKSVRKNALVVLSFPGGVDWDGNDVRVCIGIAAQGRGHIGLLSQLATLLLDPERARMLRAATTAPEVYGLVKTAR